MQDITLSQLLFLTERNFIGNKSFSISLSAESIGRYLNNYLFISIHQGERKKAQQNCIRWALREHLTPPCSDFNFGGLMIVTKLIKSSSYYIKIPLPI